MDEEARIVCGVCKLPQNPEDLMPGRMVRAAVSGLILKEHPDWTPDSRICLEDLNRYRALYVQSVLEAEKGDLSVIESAVIESLKEGEVLARNINKEFEERRTLGERLADRIAEFGGSWKFILIFLCLIVGWIAFNSFVLLAGRFDPYPFILLNLALSCLAAIQAPIIMMSQNRQEAKDRLRAQHDYQVNLKAEIEIRSLHEKIDHLVFRQWQRLLEIQEIQTELMEELPARLFNGGTADRGAGKKTGENP